MIAVGLQKRRDIGPAEPLTATTRRPHGRTLDPVLLPTGLTEDELTAQAMAADPDQPVGADARPFLDDPQGNADLLPSWYMPAVVPGRSTPLRKAVALTIVGAAVLINALGFCITYGQLSAG
jgi:hypothetical protein